MALLWLATPATAVLQFGKMMVSAMQSESGRLPAFCVARGGTAYVCTDIEVDCRAGAGVAVLSEDVFDIDHW